MKKVTVEYPKLEPIDKPIDDNYVLTDKDFEPLKPIKKEEDV